MKKRWWYLYNDDPDFGIGEWTVKAETEPEARIVLAAFLVKSAMGSSCELCDADRVRRIGYRIEADIRNPSDPLP